MRQTSWTRTSSCLSMAMMLVEALAAKFEPSKYKDNYRENLRAMIEAKIAGQEVVVPSEAQQVKVIDIMDALKASLAALKKPAEPAVEEEKPKARHKASA